MYMVLNVTVHYYKYMYICYSYSQFAINLVQITKIGFIPFTYVS